MKRRVLLAYLFFFTFIGVHPARAYDDFQRPEIEFAGGVVSAHVESVPLQQLLAELADAAEFELIIFGRVDTRVSLDIRAIPLTDFLDELLEDYSSVYQTQKASGGVRILRVYIFQNTTAPPAVVEINHLDFSQRQATAPDDAKYLEPGTVAAEQRILTLEASYSQDQAAAVSQLVVAIGDSDAAVRSRAMAMLAERGAISAFDAIADRVGDEEPLLRIQAMDIIVTMDRQRAYPYLGQVMFGDSEVAMRKRALRLLGETRDEVTTALIQGATQDQSPQISDYARDLLQ